MKLIDPSGKEITSKENKKAGELEQQLSDKMEALLDPLLTRLELTGAQIPPQQLLQLTSVAHQILFSRMVYNLAIRAGVKNMDELLSEEDIEELRTSLHNQLRIVDSPEK